MCVRAPLSTEIRKMTRSELIRMFVLDVIADDYEDLEKIYADANELAERSGLSIQKSEILEGLIDLIGSGLASAFILTTVPIQKIDGVPPLDKMKDYYFWVTNKGKELQLSDYGGWPFDEEGKLRKAWAPPQS